MSTKVKLRTIIIVDYEADPENYIEEDNKGQAEKPTPEQLTEVL